MFSELILWNWIPESQAVEPDAFGYNKLIERLDELDFMGFLAAGA